MVGLHPRNATHPGSKWHHPDFKWPPTFPIPLQLASMELGEQLSHPLSVVDNVPASSSSPCPRLQPGCKGGSRAALLLLGPAASGSNLAGGRTVFGRRCLPVPVAQGFLPAASWGHCLGPPLQASWSLHSPYTGFSVKAWVWWLKAQLRNTELISGTSFATYIVLPGPAPHDTGVALSIQSLQNCFMGKLIQLLHLSQIHSAWMAFVSVPLFAQDLGILGQWKQFLHFWICWIVLALRLHIRYLRLYVFFLNTLKYTQEHSLGKGKYSKSRVINTLTFKIK